MPRNTTVKRYNNFIAGLITEASALTYPENASIDEANFILNRDGSRRRRQGLNYENFYTLSENITESTFSDGAITSHVWENAGNSGLYNFAVIQTGSIIRFYNNTKESISANKHPFIIDLNIHKTPTSATVGLGPISVTSGKGALIIVSKSTEPLILEYDPDTDTISIIQLVLKIRDFFGIDDSLSIDENPTTLSNEHQYNLLNQGWDTTKIDDYNTSQSEYPNNTQIWTEGKDSSDVFQPLELIKQYFGTTPAPKGRYILDAFNRDRSSASNISGIPVEIEMNRPSTVAFYAGRVFYSGIESQTNAGPSLNGTIYYSQLLTTDQSLSDSIEKCYQDADPTSETISDLIATDGGSITIPEAGTIHKIVPVRRSLLVLANNGVWEISGDLDAGFTATSNQVIKVTSIGTINPASIVVVEDVVVFWSDGGIYLIQEGENGGPPTAVNMTENTIQTLYLGLSSISRRYCTGEYDQTSRKISWLYNNDDTYLGKSYTNKYNKELVFDTTLNAFYKNEISSLTSNSPYVSGYVQTPSTITSSVVVDVICNGVPVEANGLQVIIFQDSFRGSVVSNKFLTVVPQSGGVTSKITFSLYNNSDFIDWEESDSVGVDYSSFLITGYDLFQDDMRDKQVDYVTFHFNVTETGYISSPGVGVDYENPSSCLVRSRWDWSDSPTSNRWGTQFEAYRLAKLYIPAGTTNSFDYGFSTISTKNMLRGQGKAISLFISSSPGKDMHLVGWSFLISGETDV